MEFRYYGHSCGGFEFGPSLRSLIRSVVILLYLPLCSPRERLLPFLQTSVTPVGSILVSRLLSKQPKMCCFRIVRSLAFFCSLPALYVRALQVRNKAAQGARARMIRHALLHATFDDQAPQPEPLDAADPQPLESWEYNKVMHN